MKITDFKKNLFRMHFSVKYLYDVYLFYCNDLQFLFLHLEPFKISSAIMQK